MWRVFIWMLCGMFIGHLTLVMVMLIWAPPPHHFIFSSSAIWFLLSSCALVLGAILGTLFGVADTVLRSVQGLRNEMRCRRDLPDTEDATLSPSASAQKVK